MKKLIELASDTLIYGISSVLARFINYLMVPLHTKVFSTAQYGVIGLIYAAIAFLNVVFTFGMESAYLRYAKDRDRARDIFKTIQLGLLGFSTALALLLWLLSPVIMPVVGLEPGTRGIYLMMVGILWFDTLSIVPFAELRLVRRSWLFATLRTFNVLINIGLNFYLILWLNWGIEAVFTANIVASGVTTLILWLITAPMMGGSWRRGVFRQALWFGLPFVPAGIGYVINEMIDRFFLEHYLPADTIAALYGPDMTAGDVVGVYNACYKLAVFMLLLVQMYRMAWQPFFLRHSDDPGARDLYRDAFRYFNVVAGVLFLGVALFATQIVQIRVPLLDAYLIDADYWSGLHIVPILLGAYWFQGWYMNFSAGIFIEEETAILPKITLIGAIITIAGNLALIPWLGMAGSAWATLLSYAAMAFLLYYYSHKVYPVAWQMGRAVAMMGGAALLVWASPAVSGWFGTEWLGRLALLLIGVGGLLALGFFENRKSL